MNPIIKFISLIFLSCKDGAGDVKMNRLVMQAVNIDRNKRDHACRGIQDSQRPRRACETAGAY